MRPAPDHRSAQLSTAAYSALYPGGYLVAESGREPALPDDELRGLVARWRDARIGPYVVRYDDAWLSASARTADAEILVLGTAMDLDRPAASPQAVAADLATALDASDAGFLDRLDALNGAHLIFARRGPRCFVVQDATGMEALCYDVAAPDFLAASHPSLIAAIRGYEFSELGRLWLQDNPDPRAQRLKFWNGVYWFPGLTTAYAEVRALTPNTRLDLATRSVERFFPREPVGLRDTAAIVDAVADPLRDACAWVADRFPGAVDVSLSGGLDSRLTLAASRDVAHSLRFFTYYFARHQGFETDVEVAAGLTERLGLEHRAFPLSPGPALQAHRAEWRRTFAGLGHPRLDFAWVEQFPRGHVHVRSNVLEAIRGFYLKHPSNKPDRFDPVKLSYVFRGPAGPEFVTEIEEFMALTRFSMDAKLDIHYTDLFYWEQRLGRWHGELVRRMKLSHPTYVIWNNRRVLTHMLARPLEDRSKARIVYALIDRLWPEVLDAPVFSGARYVERPADAPLAEPPGIG
ncbi:MAG TPA: asparagine synthase-related protein [Solirubrobacteraceae bacterium]